MIKSKKVLYAVIQAALVIWGAFLVYGILSYPLGEHTIMPALLVAAGCILLSRKKEQQ